MEHPVNRALRVTTSHRCGNSITMRAFHALLATGKSPAEAEKAMDAALDMVVRHVYNSAEVPPSPDRVTSKAVHISAWQIVLLDCAEPLAWENERRTRHPDHADPSPEYKVYYEQQERESRNKQFLDKFWFTLDSTPSSGTQVHLPLPSVPATTRAPETDRERRFGIDTTLVDQKTRARNLRFGLDGFHVSTATAPVAPTPAVSKKRRRTKTKSDGEDMI